MGVMDVKKGLIIDLAKIKLYSLLLDKETEKLTDIEVDLMYLLAKDTAIQLRLTREDRDPRESESYK